MNLNVYKFLIENNPIHIATVDNQNKPNISIASNVKVWDEDKLIISCNQMINTQKNIQCNSNIALTTFNNEWDGIRIFGVAKFYTSGEYYDFCKRTFFTKEKILASGISEPKGAIVINVTKIEEIK